VGGEAPQSAEHWRLPQMEDHDAYQLAFDRVLHDLKAASG
jgi:hypothetical protein